MTEHRLTDRELQSLRNLGNEAEAAADEIVALRAELARQAQPMTHGELQPENAKRTARAAIGYSQAFDGRGIDWQSSEPWPHRIELAQALDWIIDLGAMVLNLADRVAQPDTVRVPREPTSEMLNAAFRVPLDVVDWMRLRYRAMIEAAPKE